MNENKIRAELLRQVDSGSAVALEKVDRYVSLVSTFYQLKKAVADTGAVVVTKNGAQEFTKTNPAIDTMNKVNSQLISLGKDMGLDTVPTPSVAPAVESAADEML